MRDAQYVTHEQDDVGGRDAYGDGAGGRDVHAGHAGGGREDLHVLEVVDEPSDVAGRLGAEGEYCDQAAQGGICCT